ncbi:MAG TPA: hypothetical protein VHL80_03600 [Polyangia bacterium]|nr:hypothetical protein [Polyangia bacterium]
MGEAEGRDNVEITSWVLLAAATVASAWCAYQASLWNGDQMRGVSSAGVAQFASTRKLSNVNREVVIDVGTYLDYVGADLRGDAALAAFLRAQARPDFKPALEAWIARKASRRAALPTPFALPEYRLPELEEMARLDEKARADIEEANTANENSDGYVLHTVLFALALFFLGGTSQLRRRGPRRAMLVLGSLVLLLTVISVARLPRARAGLLEGRAATSGRRE